MLLSVLLAASPAVAGTDAARTVAGPDHAEVDLLRTSPGGQRIYVRAGFPDGSTGLFLVDTGANISLLSEETAARLGLRIDRDVGSLVGLGGVTRMHQAVVPSLTLGDATVEDVEVAVGVPGMGTRAGAMELDGLLGNNVWSRFTLELDYPADQMVLHRPGTFRMKRRAAPMVFDGSHVFTPLTIRTPADPDTRHSVVLRVDTGAGHLSLCGRVADAFETTWSEGLEPVLGLGASETLPPFQNLRTTRRIALEEVTFAGVRLPVDEARWMNFDGSGSCPDGMRGLVGHHLMANHRVVLDYAGGKIQMTRSRRRARQIDGHAVLLEAERRRGPLPERALYRARLAIALDDIETAREELLLATADPASAAAATVLLAQVDRFEGRTADALTNLTALDAGALVDTDEIVSTVNALLIRERPEDAVALARSAVEARPEAGWSHVALADALLGTGDLEGAREAIRVAVERESYPDAHLLRRARIALASGDRHASMAHVRRLLQLYPMGGEFLWFYALLVDDDGDRATFLGDVERAMAQLHPGRRPFDFLVAAHQAIDDPTAMRIALDEGIARDCAALPRGPARDNCLAWYWSLGRLHPDESLMRIRRALDVAGERSDYLDTLAMVHLARGELAEATAAASAAAERAPDSVYMLWQAERLAALAAAER